MENNLTKTQKKNFNGKNGFNTKVWGPKLWDSLFTMILGAYPPEFDTKKPEHKKIKEAFINTIYNLKYTLPCSFCRMSFKNFYKELPIEKFTGSRIEMMYWLYLMKDKVNKKLIKQELEYLTELHKKYRTEKISKIDYLNTVDKCFMTVPTPPFIEVLMYYENNRAICNKKLKKCVSKK